MTVTMRTERERDREREREGEREKRERERGRIIGNIFKVQKCEKRKTEERERVLTHCRHQVSGCFLTLRRLVIIVPFLSKGEREREREDERERERVRVRERERERERQNEREVRMGCKLPSHLVIRTMFLPAFPTQHPRWKQKRANGVQRTALFQ